MPATTTTTTTQTSTNQGETSYSTKNSENSGRPVTEGFLWQRNNNDNVNKGNGNKAQNDKKQETQKANPQLKYTKTDKKNAGWVDLYMPKVAKRIEEDENAMFESKITFAIVLATLGILDFNLDENVNKFMKKLIKELSNHNNINN